MSKQKLDFDEVHDALDLAWRSFFGALERAGIDIDEAESVMDGKDCFNDVADCVYSVAL